MKKELNFLVYIIGNNRSDNKIIETLEKYGGYNKNKLIGLYHFIYYIRPDGIISSIDKDSISLLHLAGYKEITVEESIEEYTIDEIAKLLGKDPKLIRIKK